MTQSMRIAVADDELDVRDYYRKILPRLNHHLVVEAQSGRELVDQCRLVKPDLIITDIKMPGMDGIEAVEEISRDQQIPVVLVSAYHQARLFERAKAYQILAYLVKPAKQADLAAAIAIASQRFGQFQILSQEAAGGRRALEDRKIVERAKGLVMTQAGLDEDAAFQRLRKQARDRNQKLVDVARNIIAAQEALQPPTSRAHRSIVPCESKKT